MTHDKTFGDHWRKEMDHWEMVREGRYLGRMLRWEFRQANVVTLELKRQKREALMCFDDIFLAVVMYKPWRWEIIKYPE